MYIQGVPKKWCYVLGFLHNMARFFLGHSVEKTVLNPLAALVAPLAALALITAAGAVSVNPMLLSIATISRNKRQLSSSESIKVQRGVRHVRVLDKFLSSLPGRVDIANKLMMSYLECNGLVSTEDHCLEQLVCQYSMSTETKTDLRLGDDERDVVSMYVCCVVLFIWNSDALMPRRYIIFIK